MEEIEVTEMKIWIPGFKNGSTVFYENLNFLKDIENLVLTKDDTEYKLTELLEFKTFEFIYHEDCINSFKIPSEDDEIEINKDFICGNNL